MRQALRFVRSAVEFDEYRTHLKSVPCPHCRAVGHLNRHGFLRGKSESGSGDVLRGWRVFCSNRGRRRGCGRTHLILLSTHLHRRIVSAVRFWDFLRGVMEGTGIGSAWERVRGSFTAECGRQLWRAFERFQPVLRPLLCRIGEPPRSSSSSSHVQVLEHLRSVFPEASCPIAAWQVHFQRAFGV